MVRIVCPSVCLSVCRTRISPKLSEITTKLGFSIQNLPLDLRSEVQFRHSGQKTENGGFWGRVEFAGMHVVLAVGKRARHGDS